MRMKDIEKWLTTAEAGKVIGISKQAVHKRFEANKIRGVKTKLGLLIDPEAAEKAARERAEKKASNLKAGER